MAVVGEVYSCKVVCRATPVVAASIVSINVLHYRVTQVTGAGKFDQDIADAFDANFAATYKAFISNDASYRGEIAQKIFPLPMTLAHTSVVGQGPGTAVIGDMLPPQVSGIITKQTGGAGRAKRGRIYMPFPGEDDTTDSIPNVVYIARLQATLTAFINAVVVGIAPDTVTLLPTLFKRSAPQADTLLTTVVAREYWATQRRRSQLGGPDVSPI